MTEKTEGSVLPAAMVEHLMGPHEWGYRDPVEGGFIADDAPFRAAGEMSVLSAVLALAHDRVKALEAELVRTAPRHGDDLPFARLRGLLARATKPPWEWREDQLQPFAPHWSIKPGVLIADGNCGTPGGDEIDRANAELMVAAVNMLPALISRIEEHERSFDLRYDADMRAIKRWQEEAPGRELTWPDHADLVCWLLAKLEAVAPLAAADDGGPA